MLLSEKRIAKALIRLHGRAGWTVPLLFVSLRRQVHRSPQSKRSPHLYISSAVVLGQSDLRA